MTKYEELCKALAEMTTEFYERRNACHGFTQWLVDGMATYFGCPAGKIEFVPRPAGRSPNLEGKATAFEAAHLDRDAFWHYDVRIRLSGDPSSPHPVETAIIGIMVRRTRGAYIVKLASFKRIFTIAESESGQAKTAEKPSSFGGSFTTQREPDQATTFYDFVAEAIEHEYGDVGRWLEEGGTQGWFEEGVTERKIGFGPSGNAG